MGMLSALWTDDQPKQDTKPVKAEKPASLVSPSTPSAPSVVAIDATPTIRVPNLVDLSLPTSVDDHEYIDLLNGKIAEVAQGNKGFDFMTFVASTNALKDVVPDEVSRFKVVFTTNQVSNKLTLEDLVASAEKYISTVDTIRAQFVGWCENFGNAEINSRQNKIATIQSDKDAKRAQIDKITAQIAELTTQEANLHAEIQANVNTLEIKRLAFASAKGKIQGNLIALRDKIKQTLTVD